MATGPIPLFTPGDKKRTPFSARVMNVIVRALNSVLRMRAGPGIRIIKAEAGWVISWAPDSPGETVDDNQPTPYGGGGGSFNFAGDWIDTDYAEGDVVIRQQTVDMDSGKGGTYIALQAVPEGTPAPGESGAEEFWSLVARGAWRYFVINGLTYAGSQAKFDGGEMTLTLDNHIPTATRVEITKDDVPSDFLGVTMKLQEVRVCVDGTEKRMLVLGSDPISV